MSFLTMKTSCMFSRMYPLLISSALAVMVYLIITLPRSQPGKHKPHSQLYPFNTSSQSITPVYGTRHFMVGAYKEYRVTGRSVRIISIFRRDSVEPLYCVFYCGADWAKTGMEAEVQVHSDHFGFPFGTTDVLCPHPPGCHPTHVTLSKQADAQYAQNHTFLRIQNLLKRDEEETFPLNFTVCVSNLFGDYNNVLQFAQTLEMYKLLNVQRVVVYKTSCGPDLERLLRSYTDDGFLEVVPWRIDKHMTPSSGWQPTEHGGDIHYYGQLTTLNDCVYRYMYQSRYVLLNDIDEIITPYQHETLTQLMEDLQRQHPEAGVFLIENHIFPKSQFEPSGRFDRLSWRDIPGINIMQHIYREEPDYRIYHPSKMIIRPRTVEQTSVHSVLRNFGETINVPPQLCHIIHVRVPLQNGLSKEELHEDKRIWDYEKQLVPNVDKALERAGFLTTG
ncbi:glycosyltransferase family 92 protein F13G3.3 isoform X2 [Esox lucius]|uniref:glycosyltransferase family 92 protein F13G3.3 isoform X2 n=1 Tax=Esox lucius TaxID=8010 RepID=UPI0014770B7F|nr:glycosyltransferase family 92 protein F13G3.3 isoform X2 [Esox lucius]